MPIRGSDIPPHMGIDIILYNTLPLMVLQTQIELGRDIPLIGTRLYITGNGCIGTALDCGNTFGRISTPVAPRT